MMIFICGIFSVNAEYFCKILITAV